MAARGEEQKVYTVSELTLLVQRQLEGDFPSLSVEGEISDFVRARSGHWYFTLGDEEAQIRCVMFASDNQRVRVSPESGKKICITGRLSLYRPRGSFQMIARGMKDAGEGDLARAFEELKAKLEKEGLFDPRHKKPLPSSPAHIIVITSAEGAALHDVLRVLEDRAPFIRVTLVPVLVQGEESAPEIIRALDLAEATELSPPAELILLCRGGGAPEDLWSFNEEALVRRVFDCELPVVCGVGHEIDYTLCDFAADVRAPTPSAAAAMISPDREEWLGDLEAQEQRLEELMLLLLRERKNQVRFLRQSLRHPREFLQATAQRMDELSLRQGRAIRRQQEYLREQILRLGRGLHTGAKNSAGRWREAWARASEQLDLVSPLKILERGYGILSKGKQVIYGAEQVNKGDKIKARLARGELVCSVEEKLPGAKLGKE